MNAERIKFLAKIIDSLLQMNIDLKYAYFGEKEQEYIIHGDPHAEDMDIKSDFAIQYKFSCNEMQKLKELMECSDIQWKNGILPGTKFWIFYKFIYDKK